MAHYETLQWTSAVADDHHLSKRDRQSCTYHAYVPDLLANRSIRISAKTASALAVVENAITELEQSSAKPATTEILARLLLRAESIASSEIEGLSINARRLLRADFSRKHNEPVVDITARDILANIDAMIYASETIATHKDVSMNFLLETHFRLLKNTRMHEHAGQIRTAQNWIGGNSYNPCSAGVIPPPPHFVQELLNDLCEFCNREDLSPVLQAALAHAQFETIHPFADGNGRIGRTLIHIVLQRRRKIKISLPVSLVLATSASEYINGLTATRYVGAPDSQDAVSGMEAWIDLFIDACQTAADESARFARELVTLETRWRAQAGPIRKNSALDLILMNLAGVPILSVATAASLIDRSEQAVNEALNNLVKTGILRQTKTAARNRVFEAPDIIKIFTSLERRLASPAGNTILAKPNRRAPNRVDG